MSHLRATNHFCEEIVIYLWGFEFVVSVKVEIAVVSVLIIDVLLGYTEVSEGLFYPEDRSSKF